MAWEAVSENEVALICGTSVDTLRDIWYDWAVGIIERHTGVHNIGDIATITEERDGNGIDRITVNKPPIDSVTSVTVDGYVVSSGDYTFDNVSIVFEDTLPTNPHLATMKFNRGSKNVTLVYESGASENYAVGVTIALIVKEFSRLERSEGAEAHLQFYQVGKNRATEAPLTEWGLHGKVRGIARSLLGEKFKVA